MIATLRDAILDRVPLPDGVVRYRIAIPPSWFIRFGFLLETLEGWCWYSTEPDGQHMRVEVMPDFEGDFLDLLELLRPEDVNGE